ncbi:hypothetical protein F8154_08830 [Alkaliphilus pronyensis]|uniref:Uncharacterized protein n=1 Tax=Alkaliphilus pronyensis TaxID=1482732 RepID=A0A6I0F158_9FIRM|nr:hypothetical protein [Alkaliphilus pronyensis]KAB3534504.1 hypothetical protein F8154_08830 [Alkaliphilus pronyensis]
MVKIIYSFRKQKETGDIFLKSIVLSYFLIILVNLVFKFFTSNLSLENNHFHVLILLFVSLIIGYLWAQFFQSELCCVLLGKIGINRSFRASIWDDLVDLRLGLWIRIYLPNDQIIYQGKLRKYEEKENRENYYIILSNYTIYNYDAKCIFDNTDIINEWVAVNTKDISRIELLYSPESHKVQVSSKESELSS